MRAQKFRARISDKTTIHFTLEDLVNPAALFSIRELVIPWIRAGNKPDNFIGLLDKEGVEIYESDLIKDSDSKFIGEVIWDNDTLCFTTKFQSNELWGFVPHNCEVIGNIYEHSHLLDTKTEESDIEL